MEVCQRNRGKKIENSSDLYNNTKKTAKKAFFACIFCKFTVKNEFR